VGDSADVHGFTDEFLRENGDELFCSVGCASRLATRTCRSDAAANYSALVNGRQREEVRIFYQKSRTIYYQ